MDNPFFENWESVGRTVLATVFAYTALVIMLRISGKRTLSKMNAFDFIVTVAFGSTFATIALNKDVPLLNGAVVYLLMILMQFAITFLSVRIKFVKRLVSSQPVLLFYKGSVLHTIMKKERIIMEDLFVAMRKSNISNFDDVQAIVLETTGDISVISKTLQEDPATFRNVTNYPPDSGG